jgi:hypothetical protein
VTVDERAQGWWTATSPAVMATTVNRLRLNVICGALPIFPDATGSLRAVRQQRLAERPYRSAEQGDVLDQKAAGIG